MTKYTCILGKEKRKFTFKARSLKEAKKLALKFATNRDLLPIHVCNKFVVGKVNKEVPMPKNIEEIKEAVEAIVNDQEIVDSLGMLADRWEDEKKYEDFKDYEDRMRTFDLRGFKFVKGIRRPFGWKMIVTETGKRVQVNFKSKKERYLVAKNCN